MTRTAETAVIKRALASAGVPVLKVSHGHGSTWSHIYVRLGTIDESHKTVETLLGTRVCAVDCPACQEHWERQSLVERTVAQVIGRSSCYVMVS